MNEDKSITITPKCLQNNGKSFIGATGELWPCCWLYTDREHMEDWALRNDCDIEELSLKKYTILEVQKSNLMQKFYKSFDTKTCRNNCSTDSWKNKHNTKRGDLTTVSE